MKFFWMYSGKKKIMPLVLVLAVLALVGYLLMPTEPDLSPAEAISASFANTQSAVSYEYTVKMSTVIDGREQISSSVFGRRENRNRIHLKGEIYDSEVDFYLLDLVSYTRDQVTGKWLKITDEQLNQQDILSAELNPLTSFSFKELREAKFHGVKKINGKQLWLYSASPVINNPYMEMLWQDFQFQFWLEPRTLRIAMAKISAGSKSDEKNQLNLVVEIMNYNKKIYIKPPAD